jgi:parallel beta-helix repeat protein
MLLNLIRRWSPSWAAKLSPRQRYTCPPPAVETLESRLVPTVLIVAEPGSHFRHDFTTIQAAVNAAHSGDTIKVEPGIYQEQVTISKNNISLLALGDGDSAGDAVTIQAPANGSGALVDISGHDVTLKGFTVDGLSRITISYGVYLHNGGSGTIADNDIVHLRGPSTAQLGYGIFADTAGEVEIEGNTIKDYNKGGILVKGGARVEIEDNVVVGIGSTSAIAQNGIQIGDFPANSSDPYNALQVTRAEVEHNFVTGNIYANSAIDGFESGGILIVNQVANVEVEHNRVTGNQDGIFLSDVSGLRIEHNDVSHNTADGILMLGDRVGDPRTGTSLTVGNRVEHNDASHNGRSGIDLFDVDHNSFAHNKVVGNALDGFTVTESDDNELSHNLSAHNTNDGIALFWSRSNNLDHNDAVGNGQDGIALLPESGTPGSNDNVLDHNDADCNGRDGIRVEDSQNNTLTKNDTGGNGGTNINLVGDTSGTVLHGNRTGHGHCDD